MVNKTAKASPRDALGSTVWVTCSRPKVDRIARPWLIRRFVDPSAVFLFVAPTEAQAVAERFGGEPFDIEGAFLSHRGERCTFDTMLDEWNLEIEPLRRLAAIVRGADTARLGLAPEAAGLLAASLGSPACFPMTSRNLRREWRFTTPFTTLAAMRPTNLITGLQPNQENLREHSLESRPLPESRRLSSPSIPRLGPGRDKRSTSSHAVKAGMPIAPRSDARCRTPGVDSDVGDGRMLSLIIFPLSGVPVETAVKRSELHAFTKRACHTLTVLFCALATTPLAQAQSESPVSDLSIAQPVRARHGMVVSQEAGASKVGLDILKQGGNAVDAAIAVGFALAVTLPRAGNIGGGGFMLIHLAESGRTVAIDYREKAPAQTHRDVFLDDNGRPDREKSVYSGLAIGVPGTVSGLELAWRKYGSGRFSFGDLIAPAVRLARQGLTVDEDLADSLPFATGAFARHPSSAKIFLGSEKKPLRVGDHIALEDLADTLERIAKLGPAGFYQGPVAQKLVEAVGAVGGGMTLEDLANYRAIEREPVHGVYRGHEIVSMPPPSSGGVHIIEIANILEGFPIADQGLNSAQTIHEIAEAEKHAFADRSRYLGDPDFARIPVSSLISKEYADKLRLEISNRARPAAEISPGKPEGYESDQTTHFSIVDEKGNAVSNTYTLNLPYGCGLVAEGTGILLNNELDDFSSLGEKPNAYGLMGSSVNAPGPNKRPLSSMSPTMMFKNGELELVTGAAGGPRIISIVVQIILDVVDHGLSVAEAEEAPRIHHQWLPDELRIEREISKDTIRLLEARGHRVVTREPMGSAYTIARKGGELMGAADPRHRGTLAIGY